MRYGHKSKRQHWAGYKVHITEEPTSELLTSVQVRPANEHDAVPLVGLVRQQEVLLCDGAYGTTDARASLGELGVQIVAKLRPLTDGKHIGKEEFVIELEANEGKGSVTCPAGVTTTDYRMARDGQNRPVKLFRFPREVCADCELRERCLGGACGRVENPVRVPPGRQVQLHYHEKVLQQARAAQRTAEQKKELRERLRPRAKVERKISELLRLHGLRQGRYIGRAKIGLQAVLTATLVNTKRLLTLVAAEPQTGKALRQALESRALTSIKQLSFTPRRPPTRTDTHLRLTKSAAS